MSRRPRSAARTPARLGVHAAVVGFASAVARRHHPRAGRISPFAGVLARPAAPRLGTSVRLGILVAPRIRFALRSRREAAAGATARGETVPVRPAPTGSRRLDRREVDVVTRRRDVVLRSTTSARPHGEPAGPIAGRPSSIRAAGPGGLRTAVGTPGTGVPRPVETVVARQSPGVPAGPQAATSTGPTLEGWGAPAPAARAGEPPRIDLERLTDQVMRSIDRRLLAHRERTGRV
jgi:hypothetical protein